MDNNRDDSTNRIPPFKHREGWQPAQKGYQANPNAQQGSNGNADFSVPPSQSSDDKSE
jgi:hypothetical protein